MSTQHAAPDHEAQAFPAEDAAYARHKRSLAQWLARGRYVATQSSRVLWYGAQYVLAKRLSTDVSAAKAENFQPVSPKPSRQAIQSAFRDVFQADWDNIEAGLYPAPDDFHPRFFLRTLQSSAILFRDLPRVDARRQRQDGVEIRQDPRSAHYPAYYRQNFHYQSGGWLTAESARLYDTQVELLFAGAADAMRRSALAEIALALRGHDQRQMRVLDLACGSGRFLAQTMRAFPRLQAIGMDLSPQYCEAARQAVSPWKQVDIMTGAAEKIPLDDCSLDLVFSIYLFHELPPRIRRQVFGEIARVLKPGARFIFTDSVQLGDAPDADRMVEYFPIGFHEPFYTSFLKTDFEALGAQMGLKQIGQRRAWLTKTLVFEKSS